ncbi:PQQ-like beta-propeller repeat protein [Pontibacter sp. JH31]|uniref:PQQ-like beta-propeller repeat protein n=1 Tax=Pontibacter aquaedesilientis TaxID=2766980 RepID=A0ABR7XJM4_9BACT|nr:PQQ-like beta-propeller repeat protein [Pontibacter aquaedesilientis]MBD1398469.1 PQQ-like beta-propeller repeat protein [Pontibacter aquaedesilientis]
MPKRIVFYFIGFVLLASLVYYGFSRWQDTRQQVDLWTLVPHNAAFVVETNNHSELVSHLRETELWESFSVLPVAQRFQENMSMLDSVAPGSQRLERFLDKKNILTSVHVLGKSEVEFVYYIPVVSVGEHRFLRTLTENIVKSVIFKEETREYQGFLLTDITNTQFGTGFTYFSYHNNIILSASPVLVEEIVRRINRGNLSSIASDFKKVNYLGQPDVYANVFVNYRAMPEILGLFLKEELMPQVRYLSSFCRNAMLELKMDRNKLFLNGFSNPETLEGSFQSQLKPSAPRALEIKQLLPTRTAVLLHLGVREVSRLRDAARGKGDVYSTVLDSLARSFNQEVALAYMESYNMNTSPEKIAIARMASPSKTGALLKKLGEQLGKEQRQKTYSEQYGNYTLQLLDLEDIPARLFGEMFTGFEQSYVLQLDNYVVFAPESATLRALIDDIAVGEVWGRSVAQKSFLEETLQEGNFSLYLNTVNAWYILNRYVQEENREDLLQNSSLIRRFNQVSLQFAKAENQYYTSFLFRRQERFSATGQGGYVEEVSIPFAQRLISQPFAIQNAVDRSREIVVQDSLLVLHNITATGSRGWTDSLQSQVRGSIQQVELGNDNKLRYVFATTSRIQAIDNQGLDLEHFPFNVGDTLRLQRLAVFDYEKNRNYRFLVDDALGNLYMYDTRGNAIPGWQPRRMDYRLAATPQHLRVGGRDVILVLLENGYIYALNTQGETYPGFPFSLRVPITSEGIAKVGADLRRSQVTVVTRYGDVVVFNLQGQIVRREQLPRPSKSAMFDLLPDATGRSFVIVRQDQGKVAVFDQDLKEMFEKRFVTSAPKIVQFFNFGGGNQVYAITETGPQKTYLYDSDASLIGGRSLESNQPVTIHYNEVANNYTVYKVYRRELQKLSFKLPN